MKHIKKGLSIILILCVVLMLAPVSALAADLPDNVDISESETIMDESKNEDGLDVKESDSLNDVSKETSTDGAVSETGEEKTNFSLKGTTSDTTVDDQKEIDDILETVDNQIMAYSDSIDSRTLDTSVFYRIFHLDCGRKYFSVDQIETLIDTLAENNYTHIELAIGNDGLRFLLNDMSVTANDMTYTSDAVKAGIQAGNKAYYNAGTYNELTQTEMDTIISYANEKGIGIIPLINTPGHMDAILDCMESVGISNPAYSTSARTVDVTNTAAVNFTLALVNRYIQYFSGKGCTLFNMGCDEYANDVSNSGFAGLISSGEYGNFITYVNNMAAQVKAAGMTPMAFNDGIYYNSNTSSGTFDTDIAIAYWTSGWSVYSPASASFLAEKGHKIISTNDAWYYVLGRQAGNSSGYTIATAQNGVQNTACTDIPGDNDPTAVGCMICLWCDTPGASYSDTEVSNVTGLISTFATNNPTYFAASGETDPEPTPDPDPSNPVEVTANKTITVVVGGTETDTIGGADYSNNIVETELDKSIATVSAKYEQVEGGTEEVKATSITSGSSYYIKNSSGQYLNSSATWVSDINSAALWTATSGYTGYTLKNGNNYLRYQNSSLSTTTNFWTATTWTFSNGTFSYTQYSWGGSTTYTLGDAYTVTTTDPVNATTVTFTGVAVGTTYVTVGNTRYAINVLAEDLSKVTPLNVEYWITNLQVTADGATSKSISAQSVYGEVGVDISTLVPATGTYAYGSVVYWKGTVLDSSNKQTTASGAENDKTGSGKDFNLIRYYNDSWQYFYEADGTWNTISSSYQVVIYWLQPTEVTKEITTLVKDWGYSPSNQQGDNNNKVALTVAVVYPDGTVSPTEGDMYSTSTTLFNYWSGRDIGLVAPVNNSDYVISKITVTDGTRDQSGDGQWGANDTITWEKVTNEAGEQWYNETTYWDETIGGTPMVNGVTSNITWSNYNTAKLVLIYLKPIHYDTNLIVNWVDDNAGGTLISTMEVAVSSEGTPITFYNGLKQTSTLPTEGVGGTFTLDDDAYVTNSSNVNQTFNKNISTVPGVADQYKSGLYQYVSAELSADGKTLILHYDIDSSRLSKNYVVDFGLPVNVPLSDLVDNASEVKSVEVTRGNAKVNTDNSLTYQPETMMTGIETVGVKLTYNNDTKPINIAFIPATTVYYEEGFASYEGSWRDMGSKSITEQATQEAGKSTDEYGYDAKYANEFSGPSNGTQATSSTKGDTATFTFTGTGIDICANTNANTGWLFINVKKSGKSVKNISVDTSMRNGESNATQQQSVSGYGVPVASLDLGSEPSTYTVTITNVTDSDTNEAGTINLDGFRVYGTIADDPCYTNDEEDNPIFIEMRSKVLDTLSVTSTGSEQTDVVLPNETSAIIVSSTDVFTAEEAQDLLNNGPKNEIYLQPKQSLVFKITTDREVQIGLRALNEATSYTMTGRNGDQSISSGTDMFYTVLENWTEDVERAEKTITITNNGSGILAITKLKICDDPNATLSTLTTEDLTDALVALGITETEPIEPEEPEVIYADATLTVQVNHEATILTKNGVIGESAMFTAAEVQAAAEALVADGYELKDVTYSDVTVAYGEENTVTFTATEKQQTVDTPDNGNSGSSSSSIIDIFNKLLNALKNILGRK